MRKNFINIKEEVRFDTGNIESIRRKGLPNCPSNISIVSKGEISMPRKLTTEEFIQRASKVHNNKFDYSKVEYKSTRKKINIRCLQHGYFLQEPSSHLRGRGCPKCKSVKLSERNRITQDDFITQAIDVHNNEYTYENVKYVNSVSKIFITCPTHGDFLQRPSLHLCGKKCPKCHPHAQITTKNFIYRANVIHKNRYNYNNSICSGGKYNIDIICPLHGNFSQQVSEHLRGRGCPKCNLSVGEEKISTWLDKNQYRYEIQKTFNNFIGKNNCKYKFDFYLPNINLCIEYDGEQHFKPIYFGKHKNKSKTLIKELANKSFMKIQYRDELKNNYCRENNIKLLRIRYDEDVDEVLSNYFKL